jgi:hypothetical protein
MSAIDEEAIARAYTEGIMAERERIKRVVTELTEQNHLHIRHEGERPRRRWEPVGPTEIADIIERTGTRGLPDGIALHPDGRIVGRPTAPGTASMSVALSDDQIRQVFARDGEYR